MTKQEASQILASWLESSKGTEEQLGYIEGWFDKKDEEAFCMAIEALQDDWTPVSKGPPEVGESVLISDGVWTAEGCCRADGSWHQYRWDCVNKGVIAWRPLPEPYRESEGEE